MDFEFFNNLSNNDAKKFLNNFLNEIEKGFSSMKPEIEAGDIMVDYTITSLFPVFKWISNRLKIFPEKGDVSLPIWIRETESYKKGLYSFDEASKVLILRYSYYMGESFVRSFDRKNSISCGEVLKYVLICSSQSCFSLPPETGLIINNNFIWSCFCMFLV